MSTLYEGLRRIASEHPETRRHLLPLLRKHRTAGFDVWDTKAKGMTPAGKPLPRSKWDRLAEELRPFDWATPAPKIDGGYPEPWRVVHRDKALVWLKRMFPEHSGPMGIYTDTEGVNEFRGLSQLYVGLRDNRDQASHSARLQEMHDTLKKNHWSVRAVVRQDYLRGFYLVDDIKRDFFR